MMCMRMCACATPQVPRRFIGTDAFQETPIVEITRAITKHNYLVMDIKDLPRVIAEAFHLAQSGRPGACVQLCGSCRECFGGAEQGCWGRRKLSGATGNSWVWQVHSASALAGDTRGP